VDICCISMKRVIHRVRAKDCVKDKGRR
jgi:hypothetical protein